MEKITKKNYSSLYPGKLIVEIEQGVAKYFQYLMIHPNNDVYVLLIDKTIEEAKKVLIYDLTHGYYFIDYKYSEVIDEQINQLRHRIEVLETIKLQLDRSK